VLGERVPGNVRRFENEAFTFVTLTTDRDEITIGRLPENDVVIKDPQIAGYTLVRGTSRSLGHIRREH
jgi:pSer/pThr/pTyr-binding forkhead associated (FHA) protein